MMNSRRAPNARVLVANLPPESPSRDVSSIKGGKRQCLLHPGTVLILVIVSTLFTLGCFMMWGFPVNSTHKRVLGHLNRGNFTLDRFLYDYGQRFALLPPPGIVEWYKFATENQCSYFNYDRIYLDLKQLQESGGEWLAGDISSAAMDKAIMLDSTALVTIRKGKLHVSSNEKLQNYLSILLDRTISFLPDVDFVVNLLDEPRIFRDGTVGGIRRVNSTIDARLGYQPNLWETLAEVCLDPDSVSRFRHLHGFFVHPASLPSSQRGRIPVFSHTKIDDCFYDIVYPSQYFWNAARSVDDMMSVPPFRDRLDSIFWRGSTTGGASTPGIAYHEFHRQRLVAKFGNSATLAHGVACDVGFSSILQCDGSACNDLISKYGTKRTLSTAHECSRQKYAIDVDGNTFSQRFVALLRCGALVFRAGVFTVWYDMVVRPWEHYVPIDLSYDDLEDKIDWAQTHHFQAEEISRKGAAVGSTSLRPNDMECYMSRLLIEYARLLPSYPPPI